MGKLIAHAVRKFATRENLDNLVGAAYQAFAMVDQYDKDIGPVDESATSPLAE